MASVTASIELWQVKKTLGQKRVLDGLSLKVWPGKILVVLGPSGSGKSVLLKHLIGLLAPDSGVVKIEGVDLWAVSEAHRNDIRRKCGMSFQEGALFDSMSVFENIASPIRRHS